MVEQELFIQIQTQGSIHLGQLALTAGQALRVSLLLVALSQQQTKTTASKLLQQRKSLKVALAQLVAEAVVESVEAEAAASVAAAAASDSTQTCDRARSLTERSGPVYCLQPYAPIRRAAI